FSFAGRNPKKPSVSWALFMPDSRLAAEPFQCLAQAIHLVVGADGKAHEVLQGVRVEALILRLVALPLPGGSGFTDSPRFVPAEPLSLQ
ncbi:MULTISPECIES: hypothetical protein, partial [unclassified Halomonas]|uniref:hypothetical protein n=1 Tax=unclassified Halomonas TaxID=2609666 RepID=UPI00209EA548